MTVAVFAAEDGADPSAVYRVVAGSAYEAAKLISRHLSDGNPWVRMDVVEIATRGVDGPARVLAQIGEGGAAPFMRY